MAPSSTSDARFHRIFAEHHRAIQEYCIRRLGLEDANDAAAEVFAVAWRRIEKVPASEETLPWLYGVARNVIRNQRRGSQRSLRLVGKLSSIATTPPPETEVQVLRRSEERAVLAALAKLRPADQEILRLKAWEELSHAEIAATLGAKTHAVDMRVNRAVKRLARAMRTTEPRSDTRTSPSPREGGER